MLPVRVLALKKSQQNEAAIDPWTAVHAAAGLAFGLMGTDFKRSMALAVGYEVLEQVYVRVEEGRSPFEISGPETIPNAVVDLVAFGLGHWLGKRWNES